MTATIENNGVLTTPAEAAGRWSTLALIGALSLGGLSLVGLAGCGDSDEPAEPTTVRSALGAPTITAHSGNPTCATFNADWQEFKIEAEALANGAYTSPDGFVTVTISGYDGINFSWSSSAGLDAIFVKGGPGGLLYSYDPEAMAGSGLSASRGGKRYGISHLSFCYDVEFARIAISGSATNEVDQPHTFDVTVDQKIGFDGAWTPAADATIVTVSLEATNGAATELLEDTCASGTVAGACSVTFNSSSAGLITGNASASVNVGGAILAVSTDGMADNSASAVKRYVDAALQIGPSATNGIGEYHTFVVAAQQDDGSATGGPVADGTLSAVLLVADGGAAIADLTDTCATGTLGGECTVTFRSDTAGTITATASMTLELGGLSITRETDGTGDNSGPAIKTYVAGAIRWSKQDASTLWALAGATFEVCRTHDYVSLTGAYEERLVPACVTVADWVGSGAGIDVDPAAGGFAVVDLALGSYTLREMAAPTGYYIDPTVMLVDLSTSYTDHTFAQAFLNARVQAYYGCTPGFWKNHTGLWDSPADPYAAAAGFQTSTLFNSFFGLSAAQSGFGDATTMLQAIGAGGGTTEKLARHGISALLNLATGDAYGYPMSAAQLEAAIIAAYFSGEFEPLATQLDQANNAGCDAL